MRELNSVIKFSQSSPELYEAMKIYFSSSMAEAGVAGYAKADRSAADMEAAINKAFCDEVERRSGYTVEQFDGSVRRWANNPVVQNFADSIRDFLIDMVLPITLENGVLRYFADFRYADLGDSMSFDIQNNALYTVSKAGYRLRNTNMQKLYGTTVTLVPENRMITVGTDLFEIRTGRVSIAREVMKAARSIETALYYDTLSTLNTSMDALTGDLMIDNYTERGLIHLAEVVTAYNQGRKAIILGTPVALKSVLPSNTNYRYLLDDDYVRVGHIQTFNGYDVMPLVQVANPYDYTTPYKLTLPDNRLWVVSPASDKLIKIGIGGETLSHTDAIYDNANLLQMSTISKAWDTIVATNSVAGVIKLTN